VTSVAAVVVTYNRRDLLTECLDALAGQTSAPRRVIVVDNASTDGTDEILVARDDVEVVAMARNTGGAGGFAAGIEAALDADADAIWLLDDDTIPEPDALAELLRARDGYPGSRPAVLASRVVWTDGRDHPMNTPRTRPRATRDELDAAASVGGRPIRSASFVSILLDRDAVEAVGLPVAAYFLWNDDFEYTTRLLRDRPGLAVPTSVAVHKTRVFGSTDADPGDRFFFEVRNKIWMFTRSDSLAPAEKVIYGGATLNRWARTVQASSNRSVLMHAARRGVAAARQPPRTTDELLADARPPTVGRGRA
jgi:GT2 family glycosyltransferase